MAVTVRVTGVLPSAYWVKEAATSVLMAGGWQTSTTAVLLSAEQPPEASVTRTQYRRTLVTGGVVNCEPVPTGCESSPRAPSYH